MTGPRRVGYFVSLTIMVLGILGIPLGIVLGIAGVFESIGTGDTSTFGGGVAITITSMIMFIVGLVLSIVLKKSGKDKHVHITISSDDKDALVLNPDSLPKHGDQTKEIPAHKPTGEIPPTKSIGVEEASLQDMLQDVLDADIGDPKRLEYVAKRVRENRTIYNSDSEYVKKLFGKLRAEITKNDDQD